MVILRTYTSRKEGGQELCLKVQKQMSSSLSFIAWVVLLDRCQVVTAMMEELRVRVLCAGDHQKHSN